MHELSGQQKIRSSKFFHLNTMLVLCALVGHFFFHKQPESGLSLKEFCYMYLLSAVPELDLILSKFCLQLTC